MRDRKGIVQKDKKYLKQTKKYKENEFSLEKKNTT